jgi:hypothetical protein
MGLLKQFMIFGKSGLQGLPTRVTLPLRDIRLQRSKGLLGSPSAIHNMGLCSRPGPGEDPNTWKHFGPEPTRIRAIEPQHRPPGQRWILGQGLRVGPGPGRPHFWRTLEESCEGLGSVTLKINTQHTLGGRRRIERQSCLLVLNSASSTPPCIRQPTAACPCAWCL